MGRRTPEGITIQWALQDSTARILCNYLRNYCTKSLVGPSPRASADPTSKSEQATNKSDLAASNCVKKNLQILDLDVSSIRERKMPQIGGGALFIHCSLRLIFEGTVPPLFFDLSLIRAPCSALRSSRFRCSFWIDRFRRTCTASRREVDFKGFDPFRIAHCF